MCSVASIDKIDIIDTDTITTTTTTLNATDEKANKPKLRKVVIYYENGFVKEEYYVIDAMVEGDEKAEETKESGSVDAKGPQIKHGSYKLYYDTGVLQLWYRYNHGKLEGRCSEYYPNGQVKVYKTVKNGRLHADYTMYSPSGKIIQQSYYDRGMEVSRDTNDDNPILIKHAGVGCVIC